MSTAKKQVFVISIKQMVRGRCTAWTMRRIHAEDVHHAHTIACSIAAKFNESAANCVYSVAYVSKVE